MAMHKKIGAGLYRREGGREEQRREGGGGRREREIIRDGTIMSIICVWQTCTCMYSACTTLYILLSTPMHTYPSIVDSSQL